MQLFPDPTQIAGHSAAIPALGLSNKITGGIDIQCNKNLAASDSNNFDSTVVEG